MAATVAPFTCHSSSSTNRNRLFRPSSLCWLRVVSYLRRRPSLLMTAQRRSKFLSLLTNFSFLKKKHNPKWFVRENIPWNPSGNNRTLIAIAISKTFSFFLLLSSNLCQCYDFFAIISHLKIVAPPIRLLLKWSRALVTSVNSFIVGSFIKSYRLLFLFLFDSFFFCASITLIHLLH